MSNVIEQFKPISVNHFIGCNRFNKTTIKEIIDHNCPKKGGTGSERLIYNSQFF
jgi:hypothetical protein